LRKRTGKAAGVFKEGFRGRGVKEFEWKMEIARDFFTRSNSYSFLSFDERKVMTGGAILPIKKKNKE
jgi:hypothetical protein